MRKAKYKALARRARATTVTKLLNVRNLHDQLHGNGKAPTNLQWGRIMLAAQRAGLCVGHDGRCYIPFKRTTPFLPNGRHGRWENGRIVERKRS